MTKGVMIAALALLLGGCATVARPSEQTTKTLKVQVRAPCPAKAEYDKLKGSRPLPLRSQPMPATKEQRVAQTGAQLGKYEAEGGWGDQVEAALDRCQQGDEPVGVASTP